MKTTLFVPGLWFNPEGPLGESLSQHFTVLDQCGLPSLKIRAQSLDSAITPGVTTLIGHSAGCSVVVEALKNLPETHNIRQVILLNPGPAKGVMFTPKDPIFWMMMKPQYQWAMIMRKQFMLSKKDFVTLLSQQVGEIESTMNNLKPDSGAFAQELTMCQFRRKEYLILPSETKLGIVSSEADKMVGSTRLKTERIYVRKDILELNKQKALHVPGGHLWTLENINTIMQRLSIRQGFQF